jgi:hypothetical protein
MFSVGKISHCIAKITPSLIVDNVEVKEEEGSMSGRKTVTSKIKFSANSNDNQATYACEAVHGGLRGNTMRVSFLLSVQCKM